VNPNRCPTLNPWFARSGPKTPVIGSTKSVSKQNVIGQP
jgi:hypothetical protein